MTIPCTYVMLMMTMFDAACECLFSCFGSGPGHIIHGRKSHRGDIYIYIYIYIRGSQNEHECLESIEPCQLKRVCD